MNEDPTKRFSQRVENYVAYRPSYPEAVVGCLRDECQLTAATLVADIGSGTGILAELLLRQGNTVIGVEPNQEMRRAAERLLGDYANFISQAGRAESTGLAPQSIDLITVGQAFHWFDPVAAKTEFRRILRPAAYVALIWNERQRRGSPFMSDYEAFLVEHGVGYEQVKQVNSYEAIDAFFDGRVQMRRFSNRQRFDFQGLRGRFLSSSYAPLPGQRAHEPTLQALRALFARHLQDNQILFAYETKVFWGTLLPE